MNVEEMTRQLRQIINQPRNPKIGNFTRIFDRNHENHHEHDFEDAICHLSQADMCNLSDVISLSQQFPAPGTFSNTQAVRDGQVSIAQFGYKSTDMDNLGLVSHLVSADGTIVVNITQPGHMLYPGYVIRQVYERAGTVYMRTTGEGTGDYAGLNNFFSRPLWNNIVNSHIRYRLSAKYREKLYGF